MYVTELVHRTGKYLYWHVCTCAFRTNIETRPSWEASNCSGVGHHNHISLDRSPFASFQWITEECHCCCYPNIKFVISCPSSLKFNQIRYRWMISAFSGFFLFLDLFQKISKIQSSELLLKVLVLILFRKSPTNRKKIRILALIQISEEWEMLTRGQVRFFPEKFDGSWVCCWPVPVLPFGLQV